MLIVLRGNSGCGKSTTAKLIRDAALKNDSSRKIALVEQDYLRRIVLKEKEAEGNNNIDLIFQTVTFALERNYAVILEGILYSERYGAMLAKLRAIEPDSYFYYFDVSLEETLRRHSTKPNAHEFGEKQIREWYREKDLLGYTDEIIIGQDLSQQMVVDKILVQSHL